MGGSIDVSPQVGALLTSPERAAMMSTKGHRYCRGCGQRVDVGGIDDAALIADAYLDKTSFGFVHGRCGLSSVRYMGRPAPPPGEDVSYVALTYMGYPAARAVLVLTPDEVFQEMTPAGDVIDVWTAVQLDNGWQVMTTFGRKPPRLDGWRAEYDPALDTGAIYYPDGTLFLDHLDAEPPPRWQDILGATDEIVVLSGSFDLDELIRSPNPFRFLNSVAQTTKLIGATVAVERVDSHEHPVVRAGRSVAGLLQRAMDEVAPPRGTSAESLVPLNESARFIPVVAENGKPIIFVDLESDDAAYLQRVMNSLRDRGFPSGTAEDLREFVLPNAPSGWGCLLWPSQFKIILRDRRYRPQALWFARLDYVDPAWANSARQTGGVGVVVGNHFSTELDWLDIINDLRSGDKLGTGIPAMFAGR